MKTPLFQGAATALITPMKKDGSVDVQALEKLIDYQLENGVQALVPCGTTGEPATLSFTEWQEVIRRTVAQVRHRVPVIAGTGGNNTKDVIERAALAKALGADAQLCVTPYYNKTTQEGLIAHYQAIAGQSELPVILYSVPSRTGMAISLDTLKVLSRHPNIIGLKEAGGDIGRVGDIMAACGDELPIFCGSDEITVPMLSLGAAGVISVLSNALPAAVSGMTDSWQKGEITVARELQLRYLPLIRLLFKQVSPIPIKAVMRLMGLFENALRLPLLPLDQEAEETLRRELVRLNVLTGEEKNG